MAELAGAPRGRRYDAIVVGAGHNGLVAATYLARAGLRVVVLERRELVGGACTTEEFAPGYRASPGAYVLSLLRPAIWRDFALRRRGLEVLEAAPTLNVFRDGGRLTLHDDDRATAAELARFDPGDGAAFAAFRAELVEIARLLGPWFDRIPPGARGWLDRGALGALARGAGGVRRHGLGAAKLFATSASDWLGERFASEHVTAALGWDSISNTLAGPSTPGTAYSLLHEHAAGELGGITWGFVRGGMGEVTRLLAEAAAEAGAEVVTGAPVERILVDDGRAAGVELAEGVELAAPLVLSNADPKRTLLGLVGADRIDTPNGGRDRGLPLRGRQPEDQPRGRRAAAVRGHAGGPAAASPRPGPGDLAAGGDGRRPGERPPRGAGARPPTSSSASRAPSTTRWRPPASTWSRSASARSPTGSPGPTGTPSASGSPTG